MVRAHRPMEIELLDSEPAFLAIKDGWDELTREPLLSWEWNYCWWKHLGQDCQLRILTGTKHGKLCGIAPFIVTSRNGETCLRFIGSGKACTDRVQLIVAQDHTQEFCDAIASQTQQKHGFLSDVSLLEFEGVSPNSNTHTLCERLSSRFWSYRFDLESTWPMQLPDSWETFTAQRHKSLRRKIRKAEKRYSSGQAVAKSTSAGLDFELAFDTLVDLHQKRFTSKGEPGVFFDDSFTCFLRSASRDLAARGNRAEIVLAEVHGKPIAAQLYLHGSRGPQMYQSGICDQSMELEPGHLLFVHAITSAIDRGCTEFDFLRGDDKYKRTWGGTRSPLCTIRCVSNRLPSTLKHQMIRGLRHLNSWTKDSSFVSNS
jgi:CelD/BcsL family acetyltransferase involved in cellulose biosynthesis